MLRTFLLTTIYVLTHTNLFAQTYQLGTAPATNGATITTCSGTFYDSGGSAGQYANNENYSITFSATSGQMNLSFSSVTIETCCDFLRVYDGTSTSGTLLGTVTSGTAFTSTTGSLHITFSSDGSAVRDGWVANVSCTPTPACPSGSSQVFGTWFGYNQIAQEMDPSMPSFNWLDGYQVGISPDAVPAYLAPLQNNTSSYGLVRVDYGFNIPCNATITQVTAIVTRRDSATAGTVQDRQLRLWLPDYTTSDYNAASATPWLVSTTSWETVLYAHANWGETLTPQIVNDKRFGILYSVQNTSGTTGYPQLDAVQLAICYTVPGAAYTQVQMSVSVTGDDVCSPSHDGVLTLSATGGSGSYEYSIDGGASWQASNIFPNLEHGLYQITVRNTDGTCQVNQKSINIGCNTGKILQYGDAVIACKSSGSPPNDITLALKPLQSFPRYYQNGNVGIDVGDSIPDLSGVWTTTQLGGEVFGAAIDQDFNIYTAVSSLYTFGYGGGVTPIVSRIDGVTGAVTPIATLPGDAGAAHLEWNQTCGNLYVVNIDDGKIYRYTSTGTLLSTFDPLSPDGGGNGVAPLGERVIGVALNTAENRLYYSVWMNDAINNGIRNQVRSVAIDPATCDFLPATDRLEISLPWLSEYGGFTSYSQPVGDIEFSLDGTRMLLSETGYNSAVPITIPHDARLLEYYKSGSSWLHDSALPPGNTSTQHEVGQLNNGKNTRGGVDFAYQYYQNGCTSNPEAFVVSTADALTGVDCPLGGCYYGIQYWPITGGNATNSVLFDIGRTPLSQEKGIFGDIDVVNGCCPCASPCPILEDISQAQRICASQTGTDITVRTDQNAAGSVRFVRFTADQMAGTTPTPAEQAAIYTGGTFLADITPVYIDSPYTAILPWNSSYFPVVPGTSTTYYVYAIYQPDLGADCRPVQEVQITVYPENSGQVWVDTDYDGVLDNAETTGISGQTITAYWDDCSGLSGVVTATTDALGYYYFIGIPAGAKVRVEYPEAISGYVQSTQGSSNSTTVRFYTAPGCDLNQGWTTTTNPLAQKVEIGNYIWHDSDKDGTQDPCEQALGNVEVILKQGATQIARTYTATDGTYYFGGTSDRGFTYESFGTSAQTLADTLKNTQDDARENNTGVANNAAGLLFNNRYLGVRFDQINIPKGATITQANIRFTASSTGTISDVRIKGHLDTDSPIWNTSMPTDISNKFNTQGTTDSVFWNNANNWVIEESGPNQTTPNLASLVQQIIQLPDWERNKTLSFLIYAPNGGGGATAYDISGGSSKGAILEVSYTGTQLITGGSLAPNSSYSICVPLNQTVLTSQSLVPTLANQSVAPTNDQNDSDGISDTNGTNALISAVTTPTAGANHSFDFGFKSCETITNPSASQVLCQGQTGNSITVQTSTNAAAGIRFVRFSTDQTAVNGAETLTELQAIYSSGTVIDDVSPSGSSAPYLATLLASAANWSSLAPGVYYVYAILNPDQGAACRPVQEIVVEVKQAPAAGADGTITVCDNSVSSIDLFSLITGEQTGGTWARTSGTGGTFDALAGTYTPASGATTSTFTYTVAGIAPCMDDASVATVQVTAAPGTPSIQQVAATCTGPTSNNNGAASLIMAAGAIRYGISTIGAMTYDGPDFASASAINLPQTIITGVPNSGGTYVLRLYTTADCYTDTPITFVPVVCTCPAPNCGTATIQRN